MSWISWRLVCDICHLLLKAVVRGFKAAVPVWVLEARTASKFEYWHRALLKVKENAKITIMSC